MDDKMLRVRNSVNKLFVSKNVCKSHNIEHIDRCYQLLESALHHSISPIPDRDVEIVSLATILHDVDDRKLTDEDSPPNNNSIAILTECEIDKDLIPEVLEVISWVSSSSNGDSIPEKCIEKPWLLYPRHVDRLDALGVNGIRRAYQFTKTIGNPLFLDTTPKPFSKEDIWRIATKERYQNYNGKSVSMIDHYYDKLLRLGDFETDNPFLQLTQKDLASPLIDVILAFRDGRLNDTYMSQFE